MNKFFLALLFSFTLGVSAFAQQEKVIDKIVAVVQNEIITKSELDVRAAYMATRMNKNPNDPAFREKILEQMIDEKLLYVQARLDSIEVTDEQIDRQLDMQMNYFIQQYGSKERVEQVYGMSIERIKREFREDVKKDLMAQMVQQQKFGNVDVTRREVYEFFEEYKDSLGLIPEKLTISHIFINPQNNKRLQKKAYEFAKSLLDSLKNGADFAELARKYSDDPGSASDGGNLGWAKRGLFYPEFEAAAFALKKGEISDVVKTPVGYHIIQLLDKRGEAINARHILVKVKSDDEADLKAIEFLTEIRDSIVKGYNTFEYYARKYSDDKESAKFGGKLGTFEVSKLDKQTRDAVYKLKEGEISYPKRLDINRTTYGFHIVRLDKRVRQHKPDPEKDYDDIKQLAILRKKQKLYEEWLKEIKSKIYWEIRI
jgi:peptidyl-prolyl cis-trans isomerase SurA